MYELSGRPGRREAFPNFNEATRSVSTPPGWVLVLPQDGMLVHRRLHPSIKLSGIHLYTWVDLGGDRHYENKVSCPRTQSRPRSGLEPGFKFSTGPPRPTIANLH